MIPAARLEVHRHLLAAIAEQMGDTLERAGCSANIKERRDFSCALFDADGRLISQAAHIPVHLGSMPASLAAARRAFDLAPGDVVLLNDPYAGGTHLPDVTMIAPVYHGDSRVAFVCNRAHHADVGGAAHGSMSLSRSIFEEGLRIPPVRWYEAGTENRGLTELLLANVRTPAERLGDLRAQLGAIRVGQTETLKLIKRIGRAAFHEAGEQLIAYAERMMRAVLESVPDGDFFAEDVMDDDGAGAGPVRIRVQLRKRGGQVEVDFTGTDGQVPGCINCPAAVTHAAVYYCFVCLAGEELPLCEGMHRPICVVAPPGTVVNATLPHAVVAGNVETSQRIVDCVLAALHAAIPGRIPAAACGTMSSLSLGGIHPRDGRPFTYYETIAGGMGAGAHGPGEPGVQTHMTNTRNTPAEALEMSYPLRVRTCALRQGSGGVGRHRGGDGIVREIEALADGITGTLLADRHQNAPYGLAGGQPGLPGCAEVVRADGTVERLAGKTHLSLNAGDVIRVLTPGAGGYGELADSS